MKKNIKITTTLILAVLTAFLFTSCFDPIYGVIRTDVKPEKATVSSHMINSIARYTVGSQEYLALAANGGLRYKTADNPHHGQWATYSGLPFSLPHNDFENGIEGEEILKVVADQTTLYLVTMEYFTDKDKKINTKPKIWAAKMTEGWKTDKWTCITEGLDLKPGLFTVFSTNDVKPENRKAYLRVDTVTGEGENEKKTYSYYLLRNTKLSKEGTTPISTIEDSEEKEVPVNSVVAFDSSPKFFTTSAVVTNCTKDKDATLIYYGNGIDLYYGPVDGKYIKSSSAKAQIASLAITADSIIIGCGTGSSAGGIQRADLLENGKPGSISNETFKTNARSQIPISLAVPCLLNATPENGELKSQLYAAVTFMGAPANSNKESDKGLWSYYPNRGNWNRE